MSSSDEDELSAPELETLNISNDIHYQPLNGHKPNRPLTGEDFDIPKYGSSTLQHSLPAYDLWRPFFPTFLSEEKIHNFHRPKLRHYNIGPQALTRFRGPKAFPVKNLSKCLYRYQKRLRNKIIKAINEGMTRDEIVKNFLLIRDACDLTAKQGELFLFEYSEEYPPILNQLGMACNIKTFVQPGLRPTNGSSKQGKLALTSSNLSNQQLSHSNPCQDGKTDGSLVNEKDQMPQNNLAPGAQAENLGNYKIGIDELIPKNQRAKPLYFIQPKPGSRVKFMENNMYRAPIFQHEMPSCDFLIIRTRNSFYIRTVRVVFTVGQVMPLVAIPQPSHKSITRFRLELSNCYIHKLFMESITDPQTLSLNTLHKYFPDYDIKNLRRRILCNGAKRDLITGNGDVYWKGNSNYGECSLRELRRRFTPEQYCLNMAMLAARDRLRELNYTESMINATSEECELETEVLAAPWNTSKAVVGAMSGRAYLDLKPHLIDPTGMQREGFSCISWVKSPTEEQQLKSQQKNLNQSNDKSSGQMPILSKNPVLYKIKQEKLERLAIYQRESQLISDIQSEVLASKEVLSSDEDDEEMVGVEEENLLDSSFDGQLRDLDKMVNDGRTAEDLIFEKEEEERRKMLAEFMPKGDANNKTEGSTKQPSQTETNPAQVNFADYKDKVLKITRVYDTPEGKESRIEIVREPKIIALYVKQRSGTLGPPQIPNSTNSLSNGKTHIYRNLNFSLNNGFHRSPSKRRRSLGPMELCRAEGTKVTISKSVLDLRALRNSKRQARLSNDVS